ncbi:MAG: nucleoside triphosphate pyrophosphohydrolase [Bacteroidales bacterium]|nr:nucleoside triphosphate pyrophosphohydrolase [Bacteroidales bacterium]
MKEALKSFDELLQIMDELRIKCPWDKKQTFESLRNLTTEEVYELTEAIYEKDMNAIKKELGDILLHIVFYAKLGQEANAFTIKDVIDSLNQKLVYRHPHVFGKVEVQNATEVEENWEQLKLTEKDGNKSVLSGIPKTLPACVKAYRIQDKVRGVGFDWDEKEQVWDKVDEELKELKHEIAKNDQDKIEAEFGDLLFAVINAARLHGVHPEDALERTNRKFIKRFSYLEDNTMKKGMDLKKMTVEEMDVFWNKAKELE